MMKEVILQRFAEMESAFEKMSPEGLEIIKKYQEELNDTDSVLFKSLLGCTVRDMSSTVMGYMAAKGASFMDACYAIGVK